MDTQYHYFSKTLFTTLLHLFVKFLYPLWIKGKVKLNGLKLLGLQVCIMIVFILLICIYLPVVKIFFSGIGVAGASAHSVSQRWQATKDTFKIFLNNPIIGVSLGGIPSHRAKLYGKIITTQVEAKNYEGLNVLLETLAASGLIGYLFFLLFWTNIVRLHWRLKKKILKLREVKIKSSLLPIVNSLGIMIISEFFALLMNQNILRPYLWLSIGFYLTSLKILKKRVKYALSN